MLGYKSIAIELAIPIVQDAWWYVGYKRIKIY